MKNAREVVMPIWELLPTDKESDDWELSYKKQRVVVRAPSEDKARNLVAQKLARASKNTLGPRATLREPWKQHDLVLCNMRKDSGYNENGPDEILDPREIQ
jgi:hypothetical protein